MRRTVASGFCGLTIFLVIAAKPVQAQVSWTENIPHPWYATSYSSTYTNGQAATFTSANSTIWNLYMSPASIVNSTNVGNNLSSSPPTLAQWETTIFKYASAQNKLAAGNASNTVGEYDEDASKPGGAYLVARRGNISTIAIQVPTAGFYKLTGDIGLEAFKDTAYFRIGDYDASTYHDIVSFSATNSLNGTNNSEVQGTVLSLDDEMASSVYLNAGDTLVIGMGATTNGTSTTNLMDFALNGGTLYNSDYSVGTSLRSVQLEYVAPEPASLSLLLTAGMAILSRRSRRKRVKSSMCQQKPLHD